MTIGIAASGPRAGLAVFRALAAVERVATGSIGGFAAFAAIDADGELHRAETQRGGTTTLFVDGESTGVTPPDAVARAPWAAVMSSGPERPAPLSQYVPAEPGAGLVTGHRLPNAAGNSGRPVNLEVLDLLRQGLPAKAAVEAVLRGDREADAGIIAIDRNGGVYGCNSERVDRRPDLGHARRESSGVVMEVLHNAIVPAGPIAALAAEVGLAVMAPGPIADAEFLVTASVPVVAGDINRVVLDGNGEAQRVETTDTRILSGRHNCAAIYLHSEVVADGAVIGHTVFEPNVVVEDGLIATLNGRTAMRIGYLSSGRG
ncbi:MAG: hypothetical protein U5R46_16645 [Gammaproteobacteria bacterium]|nr:hypothetical protein [Gammaproteobacteria bacterium]